VPSGPLAGVAASAPVDLFFRPEQLLLIDPSEPCASNGTVVAQVYQGGYVDVYVDCADSSRGRVLARLSGPQATARWPIGTRVGIAVSVDEAVAFAAT
jgi:putative spermidine/putrescine transport system ATP-binding protein